MEKEILVNYIEKDFNLVQIGKEVGKAPSTITYWLNKYGLKTNHLSFKDKPKTDYGIDRHCTRCDETKLLSEFYDKNGKIGGSSYCKSCMGKQSLDRQRNLKQVCIDYKGGECQECGYNKCNAALEFHHLDPNEKDFNISELKKTNFNEQIKSELDKCALLCSNCHREVHAGLIILVR